MKRFIILLHLLISSNLVFGQLSYGVDYHIGSYEGNETVNSNFNNLSHGISVIGEYDLGTVCSPTIRLGYQYLVVETPNFLTIPQIEVNLPPFLSIIPVSNAKIYRHIVSVPIGLRFNIGSTFIHPEMGFSYLLRGERVRSIIGRGGISEDEKTSLLINDRSFVPLMLSIGHEFKFQHFDITLGARLDFVTMEGSNNMESSVIGGNLILGIRI